MNRPTKNMTKIVTLEFQFLTLRNVFVNSPPPKPEVILTNFFAEPTVLLVPITSRDMLRDM
jgi:hypothetical protein